MVLDMRKLVYIFIILLGIMACSKKKDGVSYWPSYKDDPVRKRIVQEAIEKEEERDPIAAEMKRCGTKLSQMEYIDSCLKDVPFPGGNGNWIPAKFPDQGPPDTIVDGIGYINILKE